jgi:uncharacterized protein YajQ (UPF0234 family)
MKPLGLIELLMQYLARRKVQKKIKEIKRRMELLSSDYRVNEDVKVAIRHYSFKKIHKLQKSIDPSNMS